MAVTKKSAVKKPAVKKATAVKKQVQKIAVKTPVKKAEKPADSSMKKTVSVSGFSVPMVTIEGSKAGEMTLPHGVFDAKVNTQLLHIAVRVNQANNREGAASTKTRGEVEGSTRKLFKQKGTGRARHGSVRAPIFVHGGIAFGPKPRSYRLSMTQSAKQQALASALTAAFGDHSITVVKDWSAVGAKTKDAASMLGKLSLTGKITVIVSGKTDVLVKPVRNIAGVTVLDAKTLNTYDVLTSGTLLFSKESLVVVSQRIIRS